MKAIIGFDGYFVTENGEVYSSKSGTLKRMSIQTTTNGYSAVGIRRMESGNSKLKFTKVHRLVAVAFIENPENKRTVNHRNGIRTDNRLCNLEWSTQKENVQHSFDKLGHVSSHKGKFGASNHLSKSVEKLSLSGDVICEYGSQSEAARETGISVSSISFVCNGTRKTAGGFLWRLS